MKVNINDIYIGPEMYQVINDLGKKINGHNWYYEGLIMDNGLLPLSRIDNMLNCYIKHITLPPVILKENNNNKYEIIDGRHRIVMSIIFGYKDINSILY
jgi:hypothetical protein